jgi:hypothetical protein
VNLQVNTVSRMKRHTKHDMLAIELVGDGGGDEELRVVGVLASVGHGEQARFGVLQLEVLVYIAM